MNKGIISIKDFKRAEIPWLDMGLKIIVIEGYGGFRIDSLSKKLGISRTSFYHLFKSKQNYFYRLCEYWAYSGTYKYIENLKSIQDPADKLIQMIQMISIDQIELLAWISLRHLGKENNEVQEIISAVELARIRFVSGILAELGFPPDKAKIKARVLMFYISGWLILKRLERVENKISRDDIVELLSSIDINVNHS